MPPLEVEFGTLNSIMNGPLVTQCPAVSIRSALIIQPVQPMNSRPCLGSKLCTRSSVFPQMLSTGGCTMPRMTESIDTQFARVFAPAISSTRTSSPLNAADQDR